jgi:hypothetical protein
VRSVADLGSVYFRVTPDIQILGAYVFGQIYFTFSPHF